MVPRHAKRWRRRRKSCSFGVERKCCNTDGLNAPVPLSLSLSLSLSLTPSLSLSFSGCLSVCVTRPKPSLSPDHSLWGPRFSCETKNAKIQQKSPQNRVKGKSESAVVGVEVKKCVSWLMYPDLVVRRHCHLSVQKQYPFS